MCTNITILRIAYLSIHLFITFIREDCIFIWFCGVVYHPFASTWKVLFSISCRVGLVVMNSFSFYFSGKVLISSSWLKDSFAEYNILNGFFSFSILNISFQSLVAFKVSAEIFANYLIGAPLYRTSLPFSCCFQDSLCDFW